MMWSRSQRSTHRTSNDMSVGRSRPTHRPRRPTSTGSPAAVTAAARRRRSGWPAPVPDSSAVTCGAGASACDVTVRFDAVQFQVVDDADRVPLGVEQLPIQQVQPGVEQIGRGAA